MLELIGEDIQAKTHPGIGRVRRYLPELRKTASSLAVSNAQV